jgi:hypothetical protein
VKLNLGVSKHSTFLIPGSSVPDPYVSGPPISVGTGTVRIRIRILPFSHKSV